MDSRLNNWIESFNELSILLCAQLMNIFLQQAAPPWFMALIGWTFMGVSLFNILGNVVVIVFNNIYGVGASLKKTREVRERKRIVKKRLDSLMLIHGAKFKHLSYI